MHFDRLTRPVMGAISRNMMRDTVAARFFSTVLCTGLLLGVLLGIRLGLLRFFQLPEVAYHRPLLLTGVTEKIGWSAVLLLAVIIAGLGRFGDLGKLRDEWGALEFGPALRSVIAVVTVLLAWMFATYEFNYYYGHSHLVARILLVGLAGAILWRPVFVLPFLAVLTAVVGQFNYPLGVGYERPIATLLVNILLAFTAFFFVRCLSSRVRTVDAVFLTCCIVAANFWWPGFGKLRLNWLTHGHVYLFLFSGYAHGWLAFLSPETIVKMANALSVLDWPVRIATLLLEWGALFFLWRHAAAKGLLAGWMLFHLGIFAISGFFFWPWIITEAALLFIIFRREPELRSILFRPVYFALSVLIIALGRPLFQPPGLAWYDTPLSYTYRFEALGASGVRYELPAAFFAPYRDIFTFGKFAYLTPEPQLVSSYGATSNRTVATALLAATAAGDVFVLEQSKTRHAVDQRKAAAMDHFIQAFVKRKTADTTPDKWWRFIQAPPVFWTFPRGNTYRGQERIQKVELYQVTTFFDQQQLREIRRRKIRDIEIPLS